MLIWTSIYVVLGMAFVYFTEIENISFAFYFSLAIGGLNGFAIALRQYFSGKSKIKIFQKAIKHYNGHFNLKNEPEIVVRGRKMVLGYKFEQLGNTAYEYVISNVLITQKEMLLLQKCDKKYEFEVKNDQHFIIFYAPWGYKGQDFVTYIENHISILLSCLENNMTKNLA